MHSVFSVDDFSDPFWQPPAPAMNRSESEWALEKLLEEVTASAPSSASARDNIVAPSVVSSKPENGDDDVVEIKKSQLPPHPQPSDLIPTAPIDSEEYRAFLKSELERACAAVAISRVYARVV